MTQQRLDEKMRAELALFWVVSAEKIRSPTTYRLRVVDLRDSDDVRLYKGRFYGVSGRGRYTLSPISLTLVHYASIGFQWHASGVSEELASFQDTYPFLLSDSESIRLICASDVDVDAIGLAELDELGIHMPYLRVGGGDWIGVLSLLGNPKLYAYSTVPVDVSVETTCILYDILEEDRHPMRLGIRLAGS